MKVFLFDGSLHPPTFIKILLEQLVLQGVTCYLVGFGDHKEARYLSPSIKVIALGNNKNWFSGLKYATWLAVQVLFKDPAALYQTVRQFFRSPSSNVRKRLNEFNIRNAIQISNPDLIHIQWATHIADFEYLFTESNRPKVVVSLRGKLVNVTPNIDTSVYELYARTFPKVDGFHAVSCAIGEEISKYGVSSEKISVVYSGVQQNGILKRWNQANSTLKIISIGRFHWKKGYQYALDALHLLAKRGIVFHYTIIASGSSEEIQYQIQDLGLSESVAIIPGLPHAEVFRKLAEADLFLLPSVEEGIANVVLEAMAVGVPVISSDFGGITEVIQHGENGYLFRNREVEDLALQIQDFLQETPEQLHKMVENARATVAAQHNLAQLGTNMVALYKSVLQEA